MILNRRSLLTALGLSLPAFAAEAADTTKKKKKPATNAPKAATNAPKVATNKPRKAKPTTPAQG